MTGEDPAEYAPSWFFETWKLKITHEKVAKDILQQKP